MGVYFGYLYNCYFGYCNSDGTNTPKNKSKELAEKLNHISAYSEKSNYEQARERLSALNEGTFIDIPSDLNNGFYGRVISATQEKISSIIIRYISKRHIHF